VQHHVAICPDGQALRVRHRAVRRDADKSGMFSLSNTFSLYGTLFPK
jgi:hypothetical protein